MSGATRSSASIASRPFDDGRDHLDAAFLQPARDEAAHDDGIVRDQDPDPVRRGKRPRRGEGGGHRAGLVLRTEGRGPLSARAPQTSPTSWNFAVMISLSKGFMMYSSAPACSARAM